MNKKLIRLTESDLHRIVRESVKRILKESNVGTHDYNNLPLKDGGFDSYAYEYDDALDNAKSIEEFDEMMKKRKEHSLSVADSALYRHPKNNHLGGSIGAAKYVHPDTYRVPYKNDEDILKATKDDADWGRYRYGFPA